MKYINTYTKGKHSKKLPRKQLINSNKLTVLSFQPRQDCHSLSSENRFVCNNNSVFHNGRSHALRRGIKYRTANNITYPQSSARHATHKCTHGATTKDSACHVSAMARGGEVLPTPHTHSQLERQKHKKPRKK